jgi:hypothetical protein
MPQASDTAVGSEPAEVAACRPVMKSAARRAWLAAGDIAAF